MANPVWYFLNGVPVIPVIQTGVNLAGDGSASAPSYSFTSDPDVGVFRAANNALGVSVAGARRATFEASMFTLGTALGLAVDGETGADVSLSRGAANNLALASGDSFSIGGAPAAATSATRLIKKVTGIADAVATDVITVTVPNANHAAAIQLTFLASTGSTDAFESSRVAEGAVILARTTGVATVAVVSTLELAQIATVAAGATLTLAYGVSAMSGAAGATQTFTIQVTLNDSGNVGSNQCVVLAEVINAEATGVTIS